MSGKAMSAPVFSLLDPAALAAWPLPGIGDDADKEERGSVLIVAGSSEIPGAALLSATAAVRAGAGKLLIAAPASAAPGIALAMPEARVIGLAEQPDGTLAPSAARQLAPFAEKLHAVLIGPGLPEGAGTVQFVAALLPHFRHIPVILDAVAMDVVIAGKPLGQPVLLTPHCGEMAHLTGHDRQALADSAAEAALHYASMWQVVVALKGATSWIADADGQLWQHGCGHPGMATSGSGDVLAGVIAGLAARGASLAQACAWGVVVHALAGRRLAERIAPLGFLARELLTEIPMVLADLQQTPPGTPAAG